MSELILSIIVPVYNVELYLEKCLRSLTPYTNSPKREGEGQDLLADQYEIILVDDGSTDGSPSVIEDCRSQIADSRKATYVKPSTGLIVPDEDPYKTPRIQVIHQKNKGLSAARNAGLSVAKGEYILFVDSDDYLQPKVLSSLVKQMDEDNLDVLRFNYQLVNTDYQPFWPYKRKRVFDTENTVVDGETYLNSRMDMACFAWQFVVRRKMLVENNILFTEGLYYEDVDWTPRMLLSAKRVNSTQTIVYNYLQREGSITKTIDEDIRRREGSSKLYLLERLCGLYRQNHAPDWCQKMISNLIINLFDLIVSRYWDERRQYLGQIKTVGALPIGWRYLVYRQRVKAWMINFAPVVYLHVFHCYQKCR